jgi:FecR-like protein
MRKAMTAKAALLFLLAMSAQAVAQTGPVVARAASIAGRPLLSNPTVSVPLTPGHILSPGDRVDTRGGARVVIDLSDGSLVVVQPESVIMLKDYRQADSLRELFEIVLGAVRVKINHFAGRPNPYRMNTPTASIAVRGTEFSIEVDPSGDTRVVVYEGAVEVSSLSDPDRKTLIEAGRGVLVQGGQDFHLIGANAMRGGDLAERPDGGDRQRRPQMTRPDSTAHPDSGAHPAPPPPPHNDADDSPRALASGYDRFIAGLTEGAQVPFLYRFNAFGEAHLDSLENPAYATQFRTGEGRIFVLPTFSGVRGLEEYEAAFGPGGTLPGNYSISPQISLFTPVGGGFTVGGAVSASRLANTALAGAPDFSGTSGATFYTGSLVAARAFGASSFGVELERLHGSGDLTTATVDYGTVDRMLSTSEITQTRLTAGFSHDLGMDTKVGVFYRYGFLSAEDVAQSGVTRTMGHSAEAGVRLRGTLSRRLTYGVAAMWTGVSLSSSSTMPQRYRAQRTSLAGGLGFALSRRTTLSLDLTGGAAGGRFASVHAAIQTTLTRHLFTTASYLNLWQCPGMQLYPVDYPIGNHFSDFGVGWRFTRDLFAQYVYSTDYGFSAPSHTLMLRYTFRLKTE